MKREEYISDETVIKRANAAVRIELEKNRALGVPAVIYDRESQIIYRENEDGTRTEVGKRMRTERYGERVSKDLRNCHNINSTTKEQEVSPCPRILIS